jgi:beta-mannosidase
MDEIRLTGGWQVQSTPLDTLEPPTDWTESQTIVDSTHIQPVLYPDNPYWGDRLRAINEQAWFYRRTFELGESFDRVRLRFGGVDYYADVWVNDEPVGTHEGAFVPFTLDVTDVVQPGENALVVRVTSPWDPPNPGGSYPSDHVLRGMVKGTYEHGEGLIPPNVNPLGIWRPVWLLLDEGISIDRVRIQTQIDGEVRIETTVTNTGAQTWRGTLRLKISGENHDGPGVSAMVAVLLPTGTRTVEHTMSIPEVRLWWPWDHGDPNLYRLEASIHDSALAEVFGVRTVRLTRTKQQFVYHINERPVAIRGVSYMPALYLSQVDRDWIERDLQRVCEANLNLLRVHVHVSPPDLYDLCNRMGLLVIQDFELSWVHEPSPEFEARARVLQREMIAMLHNHPAIITWMCHNEPTMIFTRRENLEKHPDPALYADALEQDPTRPVFIASGQLEADVERSGDAHTYYGAFWSSRYTDIYKRHYVFNTEFGCEIPASATTLRVYPDVWERTQHLERQIESLWQYQAELIRFHVEHFRRLRASGCAGYIAFWLADLVPQVGCGVLDSDRIEKGGYAALKQASQPLHVALEHDGRKAKAIWVFNDTVERYQNTSLHWQVFDAQGVLRLEESATFNIESNRAQAVTKLNWTLSRNDCDRVLLTLHDADGQLLAENAYTRPLYPPRRPRGYPWKFDPYLGCKVFDRPDAPSLVEQSNNPVGNLVPVRVREVIAEWGLRQRLPLWLVSRIAWIVSRLTPEYDRRT